MRYTIFFLAAALIALAALAQGHAQEPPIQLSPPVQPPIQLPGSGTGSISGRIVFQGHPFPSVQFNLFIISVDTPQPFRSSLPGARVAVTDSEGNFAVSDLADDEYFIVLQRGLVPAVPLPDSVTVVVRGGEIRQPALRVTIAGGQAVTGIEFVIRPIVSIPIIDDFGRPFSSPAAIAPATGAGPGGGDGTVGYLAAAGLAGLAAVVLAGGVALRRRGSRAR